MKKRPKYFLGPDRIDQGGEIFDYISELHRYLWRFVRVVYPDASGSLGEYLDEAIERAENGD